MSLLPVIERSQRALRHLRDPFLAAVRVYWGWQFALTGWGKLTHFDHTVSWFQSLGIPMAPVNAGVAGTAELLGGLFLALGLLGRPWALVLSFTMIVAYATAHGAEASSIFSEPTVFAGALPFPFLMAALVVLALGSGRWSADHLLFTWLRSRATGSADHQPAVAAGATP